MELQSIIVLIVVWLIVAIPAIYFIIKGSKGDCTNSEKAFTRKSAWGSFDLCYFNGIDNLFWSNI